MIATAEISIRKEWLNFTEINNRMAVLPLSGGFGLMKRNQVYRGDNVLILGLGNTLLSDDGAGIYVVREIGRMLPSSPVVIREAAAGGLEILEIISGFQKAVLVDAVQTFRHKAGALIELNLEDLKGGSAMTRHHVSLAEAIELGHTLRMPLPEKLSIYGIEVADTRTFQEGCTTAVAGKIKKIARDIIKREHLA
jgi:hydrogenase maturation protease